MITREQFDTIYTGLAAQNWERSERKGLCKYRGPNNLKCAIGHLIPDDVYRPNMEGNGLHHFQELGLLLNLTNYEFDVLQSTHDHADTPDEMRDDFNDLKEEFFTNEPA